MGTSTSFKGPKNNSPLLPPWAASPDSNDAPSESTNNWRNAKTNFSKAVSRVPGYTLKNAAKAYVKALGSGRNAANSAIFGKNAASTLGGFFGSVATVGITETLKTYGFQELIGKPAEIVFAGLIDRLAPNGATNEESNARKAIIEVLSGIYEKLELEDDISGLDSLTAEDVKTTILECCKGYIYERWLQELGIAVERKSLTPEDAISLEKEIKDLISSSIDYDFGNKNPLEMDFQKGEGKDIIESIFLEAYSILEL